mmetsp:Transcript_18354/g.25389  ORF Transcript_18354/g.25389 Transcript_18354/m.25389 type:complete len:164 (-) Transcript_18354:191-682(-)
MADNAKIKIRSERPEEGVQKKTFELSRKAVDDVGFIKNLFEGIGELPEVVLPEQSGIRDYILEKVIEFLEYRVEHPELKDKMNEDALDKTRTDNLHEWDQKFIDAVDKPTLFRIILAANVLDIQPLLMVAQKKLANMIKSMTTEQIKTEFLISEDLPPDQRKP